MAERPTIILGAGATKACGGPLTDEILPASLHGEMAHDDALTLVEDREELLVLSHRFLHECFNVPDDPEQITRETCPSLPMVLSMLRRSVLTGLPIGNYQGDLLIKAKRAIEYAVFAVIEAALRKIPADKRFHHDLLKPIYLRNVEPTVISLNYDVIADNAMFFLSENHKGMRPPDYCVDIVSERYRDFCTGGTFGRLLKIHGSLNWLYCSTCGRLDLFVSKGMRTGKALDELYHAVPFNDAYSCRGTPCRNPACDGFVSPILITPTFVKDYENPHIERVWREAETAMQAADRAVIIGYSLPSDDVEVAMLFKRGLDHLPRHRITVVEYVPGDEDRAADQRVSLESHDTGRRFRSLLGPGIDWHTTGFKGWLAEQKTRGGFPFS